MNLEVELKLAIRREALDQARAHPSLEPLRDGTERTLTLSTTYYDTRGCALRSHGVALRMRRVDEHWVQSVKGAGGAHAGMHRREEYEWPVTSPRIDRPKLATTPWAAVFAGSVPLQPLFRTEIVRVEQPLRFSDGTRAVLCFDRGRVRAGRRQLPLCEIEIELVEGDLRRLYEAALALAADLPLSIASASKAQRGYELALSIARQPVRAAPVELRGNMGVPTALAALGAECLGQVGSNAESIAVGVGDDFLHQLRVGVRRLRSLLRLVERELGNEAIDALVAELRWLGGELGPARDWDVFATDSVATALAAIHDVRLRKDAGRLRYRVTRTRGMRRKAANAAIASGRFTRLMLSAGLLFASLQSGVYGAGATGRDARTFEREMLGEQAHKLRKRGKRVRTAPPAERHRVRIAAKKLRYTAEFFAPLFSSRRAGGYVKRLAKLQGVLGTLNDMATAQRLIDEIAPPSATPAHLAHAAGVLRGWTAAIVRHEAAAIGKAWKSFKSVRAFWN